MKWEIEGEEELEAEYGDVQTDEDIRMYWEDWQMENHAGRKPKYLTIELWHKFLGNDWKHHQDKISRIDFRQKVIMYLITAVLAILVASSIAFTGAVIEMIFGG